MGSLVPFLALVQYEQYDEGGGALAGCFGGTFAIVWLALLIVAVVGLWKVFQKAGEPGWASIIPIYNAIVLLKIAGRPLWWLILLLIPVVNLVIAIIVSIDVARKFGQGTGFGLGLAFLPFIFYPMLGFGGAQYNPSA